MRKSILIVISVVVLLFLGTLGLGYRYVANQGENPKAVLNGIIKLEFANKKIAALSETPEMYILKSSENYKPFIELMKSQKLNLVQKEDRVFYFEDKEHVVMAEISNLSKYFKIVKVTRIFEEPDGDDYIGANQAQ